MLLEMMRFVQSFHTPWLDTAFSLLTQLGEDMFFLVLFVVLYWSVDKAFALRTGLAYMSAGALNSGLKALFHVPRPIGQPGIRSLRTETATGWSFPSGHSTSAASLAASVWQRSGRGVRGAALVLMFLTGLSRVYLGVHTPLDVVCGWVLGFAWTFLAFRLMPLLETRRTRILPVFPFLLVLLLLMPSSDAFKALGAAVGFVLCYILEPRLVGFSAAGSLKHRLMRLVPGLIMALALKSGLKVILPAAEISDFLRYFLLSVWVMAGAPALFLRLGLCGRETVNADHPPKP